MRFIATVALGSKLRISTILTLEPKTNLLAFKARPCLARPGLRKLRKIALYQYA